MLHLAKIQDGAYPGFRGDGTGSISSKTAQNPGVESTLPKKYFSVSSWPNKVLKYINPDTGEKVGYTPG